MRQTCSCVSSGLAGLSPVLAFAAFRSAARSVSVCRWVGEGSLRGVGFRLSVRRGSVGGVGARGCDVTGSSQRTSTGPREENRPLRVEETRSGGWVLPPGYRRAPRRTGRVVARVGHRGYRSGYGGAGTPANSVCP